MHNMHADAITHGTRRAAYLLDESAEATAHESEIIMIHDMEPKSASILAAPSA